MKKIPTINLFDYYERIAGDVQDKINKDGLELDNGNFVSADKTVTKSLRVIRDDQEAALIKTNWKGVVLINVEKDGSQTKHSGIIPKLEVTLHIKNDKVSKVEIIDDRVIVIDIKLGTDRRLSKFRVR